MNIQDMNDTLNSYVKPSEIMNNMKGIAKEVAGVGTIETEIIIERASDTLNKTINNLGNTGNTLFKDFINTAVDGVIRVMDKKKEMDINTISIMNNTRGLYPRNQIPNQITQQGGNNESEFMKYVYTEKPIWFTKKDMIWN
jgi:hypothetical protein